MRSEKFGRLLKGAIGSIVAHEGKTAPLVEEELGQQMGLSPASIQRYKAGHIPPDRHSLEILALAAVKRGFLNREWLYDFLQTAHYTSPTQFIEQLYPPNPGPTGPKLAGKTFDNLPAPTYGKFIERPQAYAQVVEGLQQRSAVVLLVSLGGMGKTSLAREIANDCLKGQNAAPRFGVAVWVSDQPQPGSTTLDTVLDEIALTLEYPGLVQAAPAHKRREVETLLRRQPVLLVVDNFETVTDNTLVDWLLRLPEPSKALITTREYRREFRRNCWPVELDGLSQHEALQFLLEKVNSLKMEKLVGDIARLDPLLAATGGNPKALELALGYLKYSHQGFSQVLADLEAARGELFDDLFRRTWETLDEPASRIFRSFPLFSSPALGESVAFAAGVVEGETTLERLTGLGLVDLQKADIDSLPRYSLHPLVRAFAEARLHEQPEFEEEAQHRQLEWYIELAAQVGYAWNDLGKLKLLDPEQETLHSLILRAARTGRYAELSRLLRDVDYFYHIRGLWKGQPSLSELRVEAASKTGDRLEEVRALAYYVQTLCRQQQLEAARPALTRLQELNSSLTLPDADLFEVEYTLGLYRMACQDFVKAIEQWQTTLLLAQRVSARAYAVARGHLAISYYRQGQPDTARSLWQAVLGEASTGGFLRGAISSRIGLARLHLDMGELDAAKTLLDEAATLAAEYQDRERAAEIDGLLARYHHLRGDPETARQFGRQAIDAYERLGLGRESAEIRDFLQTFA